MTELVTLDIGGTHARFAIATLQGRQVAALGDICTLNTTDYSGLQQAWQAFATRLGRTLPTAAAIAVAAPIDGETLQLTNNPWTIRPASIPLELGVDCYVLINDFGAVGHAVAQLGSESFRHLFGPDIPLPHDGVISIVGPGTGLGVAQLVRQGGRHHVVETEGGHIDFAPLDALEDRILAHLRGRYGRVSAERLVSGPGLFNIYEALARIQGSELQHRDEKSLWAAALAGDSGPPSIALDRFCRSLGSVAGDLALAQGADALVLAGGLGLRIADRIATSAFYERFIAKGRFEPRMRQIPVKLITHPQPGLLGAAAAFAEKFG